MEIYSPDHLRAYGDAAAARPGWQGFVESTGSDLALLQRESALADALVQRLGWSRVATTEEFVLLARSSDDSE
jgi:hypothetical protein